MPCTTGQEWDRTDYEAQRKIEQLTRVSCDIMRALENGGVSLAAFGPEVQDWWNAHKADDAKREAASQAQAAREELRAAGLAKLTDVERKALGL